MEVDMKVLLREHNKLCHKCQKQYERKQTDYNDSFGRTYRKLGDNGIFSAYSIITNKYNRFDTIVNNGSKGKKTVVNESLIDTLMDMADYCFMTIMELQREAGIQDDDDDTDVAEEDEVTEVKVKESKVKKRLVESRTEVDLTQTHIPTTTSTEILADSNDSISIKTTNMNQEELRVIPNIPRRSEVEIDYINRVSDH